VDGVWRLTRFPEYVWFVPVTTLLGAAVGGGAFGWRLFLVLLANWLAVAFAFMINDVEDAPDDALNPAKIGRNPVSAGDISARTGRILSFLVAGLAGLLYAWLGLIPFMIGAICLGLAYLYSARFIRLKAIPVADLLSHALMLAGLQFLAGYFTFGGGQPWQLPFPLIFVLAISLYGQLFNELRDLEGDVEAGVTHTAYYLGIRAATILMMTLFVVGVAAAVSTIVVIRLIPTWVLLLMAGLAAILALRPLLRVHRTKSNLELQHGFQKPLEIAAAVALVAWFAAPPAWAAAGWLSAPLTERWALLLTLWPK
jgi:4-hydroxybenzoate polyprenyltransferase